MLVRRAYDRTIHPPGPVAEALAANPETGRHSGLLQAKIDVGSSITIVPSDLPLQLGVNPHGVLKMRGYDGRAARRPVYFLQLVIEGFDVGIISCAAMRRSNVLLGRDVLNRFIMTLDGKKLTFSLEL